MDDGASKSAGEHDPRDNESAKTPPAGAAASGDAAKHEGNLPVVWAPKLDAAEEAVEDFPSFTSDETTSAFIGDEADDASGATKEAASGQPALSRSLRFAMLAASLAAAAAFGSFAGALSASGVMQLWGNGAATATMAAANAPQAAKAELAELSALKANIDAAARNANGQFAKIADRLDHLERAQIEPTLKLAHIADAVDRLDKKSVVASAAPAAPPAPETTGSIAGGSPATASDTKPSEKVLQDWIVQDVRGGRALIESRYGAVFDVAAGSVLPGLGRIETIKRQDGQWVVVTARGLISSAP